eukprot:1101517-Rhodomonas_salina.2
MRMRCWECAAAFGVGEAWLNRRSRSTGVVFGDEGCRSVLDSDGLFRSCHAPPPPLHASWNSHALASSDCRPASHEALVDDFVERQG